MIVMTLIISIVTFALDRSKHILLVFVSKRHRSYVNRGKVDIKINGLKRLFQGGGRLIGG